ncbi:MAG: primosomal protein N' [Desulfuromonadales bacterium]|nr:primosomal protein N' [Desulfuromonadales bacterium]
MTSLLADIAVNAPVRNLFSYRVPPALADKLAVGARVQAPFGRRAIIGVAVRLYQGDGSELKELRDCLDESPLLDDQLLRLLRWAADYYHYPYGQVIKNALPGGLMRSSGQTEIATEHRYRRINSDIRPAGRRQQQILSWIEQQGGAGVSQIRTAFPSPTAVLKRLVELGCLEQRAGERLRDPFLLEPIPQDKQLTLNDFQRQALEQITAALSARRFQPFLLHGVTGSGKTEVYLRAVAECLQQGRQALILVPEISLTPQLVSRFRARFEPLGEQIATLHSGLSAGERYDAWRAITRGQVNIVIGARSAIFAPLPQLGLIIVDEEHDASYKQGEGFRYHARDLALVRGQQQQCPVVLGSATPSLASYYRCEQDNCTLLPLPERVHAGALPAVELVDLRSETLRGVLAESLIAAITTALEQRQQVLLLLNRRGFAPFLLCTDCGTSFHCPNCEITLTYHQRQRRMICHYCDYQDQVPEVCPACRGERIIPQGAGTERLEEDLAELFPAARIARMDRDTTRTKGSHQRIVNGMMTAEVDILVGTQMIAKGHDFPNVALVGVLGADSLLNLPDFRSAERSFALLTQVAGRAGRAVGGGKVFIQTYHPEHFSLTCAAAQDVEDFYLQELPFRRELGYPPCGHLVNLIFSGNNGDQVNSSATKLARHLQSVAGDVEILGPSPCPLTRLRGKYRYQILLKSPSRPPLRRMLVAVDSAATELPRQVSIHIDIDPLDMF